MSHEVKHGQTLWHIAIQYGTTAEQISGSPATPWLRGRPTQGTTVSSPNAANLVRQNSTVVAALLIGFFGLVAGIVGFGRKKVTPYIFVCTCLNLLGMGENQYCLPGWLGIPCQHD